MAVWAIKPGCFLWLTADVTGGGFNRTADGALAGPTFLRYRWHSLVEEPQRCSGICMTSPLDCELRLFSNFPARRLTAVLLYTKRLQFPSDHYKGVGVCDGGVLHPL